MLAFNLLCCLALIAVAVTPFVALGHRSGWFWAVAALALVAPAAAIVWSFRLGEGEAQAFGFVFALMLLVAGALSVFAGAVILNWHRPDGDKKFGRVT